jgi:hypothetical protein
MQGVQLTVLPSLRRSSIGVQAQHGSIQHHCDGAGVYSRAGIDVAVDASGKLHVTDATATGVRKPDVCIASIATRGSREACGGATHP